jgi:hypothetical protein
MQQFRLSHCFYWSGPWIRTNDLPYPKQFAAVDNPDVVRMGDIAGSLFDCPGQGRFVFAATHLEEMLQDLRRRHYAESFPG